MPLVARLNDLTIHTDETEAPGSIVGGSLDVLTNALPTARIGDPVECAAHGAQVIATGSLTVLANGLGVARLGDGVSCGAIIITGSPTVRAGD